jgi:plastocyanin
MKTIIEDLLDESKNIEVKPGSTIRFEFADGSHISIEVPTRDDDDREQIKVTTFGQLVIEPESSNVAVLKTRDD